MAERTPARDRILASLLSLALATTVATPGYVAHAAVDSSGNEMPKFKRYGSAAEAVAAMTTNLTLESEHNKAEGLTAPYLGERELRRKMDEDLAQKGQHTVFLIGPRGAGKTAYVLTVAGELKGRTVYSLKIGSLIAGTAYRGELEENIEKLLEFFMDHPERILFIDEIHSLLKIEGVADLLKPAMGSKRITIWGASTEDEHAEIIEENPPLVDRTTSHILEEFTMERAIDVLRANAKVIETNLGVYISDEAIERAVKLTFLYYTDRSPSRTPIRILERAAMRKKFNLAQDKEPFEKLKILDRIERAELAVERLEKELARKEGKTDTARLKEKLEKEKTALDEALADQIEVEQFYLRPRTEARVAELEKWNDDFLKKNDEQAIDKKDSRWETFNLYKAELEDLRGLLVEMGPSPNYYSPDVEADDVGRVVAADMGMTNQAANESDVEKLARLRKEFKENFFGNDHVVNGIMSAIEERLLHVDKISGPIGVFGLFGAKGRGKTTVEQVLAKVWYGDASRVVRISMNSIKGLGSAAIWGHERGIVDSEKGGYIDKLRRRAHSLLNLDEVEKGADAYGRHENLDSFHQAFDQGYQHDARNRKVSFLNTLVLMTGNILSEWSEVREFYAHEPEKLEVAFRLPAGSLAGKSIEEMDKFMLERAVQEVGFSESIVDRITDMFVFNAITKDSAKAILRKAFKEQAAEFFEHHGVRLDFGDLSQANVGNLADVIVDHHYNANHSARYYHRLRKILVNTRLAEAVKETLNNSNSGKFLPDSILQFKWVPNPGKESSEDNKANRAILSGTVELTLKRMLETANGPVIEDLNRFEHSPFPEKPEVVRPRLDMAMYVRTVDKPELKMIGRNAGDAGRAIDPRAEDVKTDAPERESRVKSDRPAKARPVARPEVKPSPRYTKPHGRR